MTEDVTRGLTALADEAEPATIDTHAVVTRARARTRNRRTTTAVFAAVVAVGALTVTLTPGDGSGGTTGVASSEPTRAERLTDELAAAAPNVIPADWQQMPVPTPSMSPPALTFTCVEAGERYGVDVELSGPSTGAPARVETGVYSRSTCDSRAYYRDEEGSIDFRVSITDGEPGLLTPCTAPDCARHDLPGGIQAQLSNGHTVAPPTDSYQDLTAVRPDGTTLTVTAIWSYDRSAPPMTDDELLAFADLLTF